ncbi:related to MFS transporter [Ramularia collo-cygni]|uniref:Related to MFS transporter n=1 Tax=Ramularia collo-cygni TaxID=112498 RepID=A0A2D3V209_9PEZI|nr:related to MFS transporter [Ramularia collo-cygni]CZT24347.1 related to MFS transporter [Ramularia collo-cygni]
MHDAKSVTDRVEDHELHRPKDPQDGIIHYPDCLQGLSEMEVRKLGNRTTMKMDLVVMPALVIMYILNYLDRQNIAAAKLAGINEDLGLSITQYNTVVSILFVGYILMQVPSNLVVSKIKWPGLYICAAVALWGIVSACTAVVHSFGGLLACRFMLGLVEAAFFPGAFYYLSMFYNRRQIAFRTAILYSGSQLGNAFGTLLAIGITELDGKHGFAGWRWLFLIEGVATVGFALIFATYLPNSPSNIVGMSDLEHEWLRWNYQSDQKQEDNASEVTAKQGFLMAFYDPKTWLMMGTLYATYTAAAVNNFFPTVVDGLGFTRNASYGLTAPPFILCVICMLIVGFDSDKRKERYLHIVLPLTITVVANIIAVSSLNVAARYFAMMLMPASFYSSSIVQLSWISSSLSQPAVKRAASIALINCICNTPNIWTAYLYYDSPRYVAAFAVNLGAAVVAIGMATVSFLYLRRQNSKLDRGEEMGKSGPTLRQQAAGFRYML